MSAKATTSLRSSCSPSALAMKFYFDETLLGPTPRRSTSVDPLCQRERASDGNLESLRSKSGLTAPFVRLIDFPSSDVISSSLCRTKMTSGRPTSELMHLCFKFRTAKSFWQSRNVSGPGEMAMSCMTPFTSGKGIDICWPRDYVTHG
jgi:hypothetical protein